MNKQNALVFIRKLDKVLASWVKVICVSLLVAIILTVSVSVFTRFVMFNPLNFAGSLSKYLMIWLAFLGVGLAINEGEHVAVDMFVNKLKGKAKKALLISIDILVSIFLVAIIYYGFIFALDGSGSHDPLVFGLSLLIPYLAVPVGALYTLIQLNIVTLINILGVD